MVHAEQCFDYDSSDAFEVFSVPGSVDDQGFANDDVPDDEDDIEELVQAYRDFKNSLVEEDRDQYSEEDMCDENCQHCQVPDESGVDCGYLYLGYGGGSFVEYHSDVDEADDRTVPNFESDNQPEPNRFCHALDNDETMDDEIVFEEQSVYEDDV